MSEESQIDAAIRKLYLQIIEGWNKRDADGMSSAFAGDGEMIGFDEVS